MTDDRRPRRSGQWLPEPRKMRSLKIEQTLWDHVTRIASGDGVSRSELIRSTLWGMVRERTGGPK